MYGGFLLQSSHSLFRNEFFSPTVPRKESSNTQINLSFPDFSNIITENLLHRLDDSSCFQESSSCFQEAPERPHTRKLNDKEEEIKAKQVCENRSHASELVKEQQDFSTDKNDEQQDETDRAVALVALLKSCANQKDLHRGYRVHAHVIKNGLLEKNVFVGSALVSMYAKCGALQKAQELFDEPRVSSIVSWNALIAGYVQHGNAEKALDCFDRMIMGGLNPDEFTLSSILTACGDLRAYERGCDIHANFLGHDTLQKSAHVGTALVDMYARCGALAKAQEVFDELPVSNVFSWNVLIGGYAHHGHNKEALNAYALMQGGGVSPHHPITLACILKACSGIGSLNKGQAIHAQLVKTGLLEENVYVGNALIDMYAKCGVPGKAQEVFDELLVWDVVSWNALIGGYVLCGDGERVIKCFEEMQQEGLFLPDGITFSCVLKACGTIGIASKGKELHAEIVKYGLTEKAMVVDMAMVEMYANCGMLGEAQDLFNRLPVRDVISWGALLVGYAHVGHDKAVFRCFEAMVREGTEPDMAIFTVILNTCSKKGLLKEGQEHFQAMSKDYGKMPILDHHTCMVDLFSRAGRLDKALAVVEEMPFAANFKLWDTLLGASHILGKLKVGHWAFQQALQQNEVPATAYVGMSNIYAAADMME